ncbi:MAG: hypothetical protein RIC19_25290 [Phaeodactylibacter sp.]|uniref:hypothetical protein n=1 Tax=Phaeodactylibacter sp. TaxID=1940289 RepID=UPI0032EC771A
MYTLTIVQAISIALLSVCPVAQPGLTATSTDIFGTHQLHTAYGLMNVQVGTANEGQASKLSVGPQYILIKNAPLIRVMQLMDRPIAPCPLTAYDYGPPPSEAAHPAQEKSRENALLAERINFKISCSDCHLEDLQEVAFTFLQSKVRPQAETPANLPLLTQNTADQTNR